MSTALHPILSPTLPGEDDLPSDDGVPMETWRHVAQMTLLVETLRLAWARRDDYYAGGNMFMYFSARQLKKNDFVGPDVFVVLDTVRRERKSWVVWDEDGRTPNVVVELLSESTEENDRGKKMRIYATRLHVREYFLYDPFTFVLEGYQLRGNGYVRIDPDEHGDLPSRELGLRLGVRASSYHDVDALLLRWLDAEGRVLPSGQELGRDAGAKVREAEAENAVLRARVKALEGKR